MTPLLFIPGMMCDQRMWGGIPVALGASPFAYAIPSKADTMAELARIILRDAPKRFALAGLSMGGIVAMEILAQAPERVERIALLDTNPLAETPEIRARRELQIAKVLTGRLFSILLVKVRIKRRSLIYVWTWRWRWDLMCLLDNHAHCATGKTGNRHWPHSTGQHLF